jgi:hypothetical protein
MEKTVLSPSKESHDHEEGLKGTIQKGDDGFWRFYGSSLTVLTCKDCRMLSEKLSALNISAEAKLHVGFSV